MARSPAGPSPRDGDSAGRLRSSVPVFPDDAGIFDDRLEKAAAGLVAIAGALEHHHVPGREVAEFLELYARIAELPPEAFTRVWTDPGAYCWLHRAYELLQALLGGAVAPSTEAYCHALGEIRVERALARHLDELKRFAVSLHHLSGVDGRFASALDVPLPFVLPGTDLWLDGSGSVGIVGMVGGKLALERDGNEIEVPLEPSAPPVSGVSLRRSPVVRQGGCEIVMQPHALAAPGVDMADAAIAAGLAYQERHVPLLVEALGIVERHAPETFRSFRDVMRVIAFKPIGAGGFTNISHSDFPGASVMSVVEHPFELAAGLIHEFHHHVLFALEERGGFFAVVQNGISNERYYSPWRSDLRPLRGILLGVHVYVAVGAYWLRVHAADEVDDATRRYALDRVLRLIAQLEIGVAVLERHAEFSSFGGEIWSVLLDRFAALRERVAEASLPEDAPALLCRADGKIEPERGRDGRELFVREVVAEHRRRHDPEASMRRT